PLTALTALVLIGIGGFMAGRVSSPTSSEKSQDGPAETRSTRSSARNSSANGAATKSSTRGTRPERDSKSANQDRLARLESIIRGENPLDRSRALLAYIDQLGPGDFEGAVAHFRSLGLTEGRMGEYSLLLTAWAQADPLSALAYAKENTSNGFAAGTILTSWASTDPEAAIRWAQANHEGDGANPFLPGIIRGIAEADPARATQLLTAMPKSVERGNALDFMLPHLLQQGTDATRAWITAITDDSLRNGAMVRVAEKLAATDPAGTVSWLLANPGEASERRIDDIYSAWSKKDEQAAWSSFNTLPAGEARSNALRGMITNAAAQNPKEAFSLMDRYPNDVNDRLVRNFIWHSFGNDPATAVAAIARIGDQSQRDQMYRRTLDAWQKEDPASAEAWLRTNPGALAPR
ncbi:MAG: hypothetical protein ACRDBP_00035, partial [Luteolibacter sp.]